MALERGAVTQATLKHVWVDLQLGDSEVVVREFSDGMFACDLNGQRLILSVAQMQELAGRLMTMAAQKGWT